MANTVLQTLPLSFTQDFRPERRLLSQLLYFTRDHGEGDKHQISELTGIPTGKSTGKVEPMIYYAIGMGLILANRDKGYWSLKLTILGQQLLSEDPYLSEEVSLWLIHLMLSRPSPDKEKNGSSVGVVRPWFSLFSLSHTRLGITFTANDYENFMGECFGSSTSRKKMCKVTLSSYEEDSCLGLTNALLLKKNGSYERQKAPFKKEFYPTYTACFFLLWDEFFLEEKQLSLNEFFECTRMLYAMHWSEQESKPWVDWMVDQGRLQLDRQTGETLALRTTDTMNVLNDIYSELI